MSDDAHRDAYRDELERRKRASVAQLLFKAARLWDEVAVARIRGEGVSSLRTAHTALLPHIPLDGGVRPTELARRVGVTKQAIGQLLGDMEAQGVVERVPDPTDGRAQLVRFTARGREALLHGLAVLKQLEDELAEDVGRERLSRLLIDLTVLVDALENR